MQPGKKSARRHSLSSQEIRSRQRLGLVLIAGVLAAAAIVWTMMTGRHPTDSGTTPPVMMRSTAPAGRDLTTSQATAASPLPTTNTGIPATDEPDGAMELQNAANKLLDAGKLPEAIQLFEKAAKVSPDDEEIQFSLGFAYARAGRISEAIKAYERALEIFPDHTEAHNNLGNLLVRQRRFGEAMEHYSAILKLNPDSASGLNNLGRCLAEQGKFKNAITQFTEAIRLKPDYAEARCNLGNALLQEGRVLEATAQFNEALRISPGFPPAIAGLRRIQGAKP